MGYRSDVALGISFPNTKALISFVSAQRVTGDKHMQEAIKEYRITHMSSGFDVGLVLWTSFEDTKWYPDYEDVKAHERILANAKLLYYSTIFIEIGEEINDIKYEADEGSESDVGILYDCLGVSRRLIQPDTSQDIASFVKEN
jgi:hypothetical protein